MIDSVSAIRIFFWNSSGDFEVFVHTFFECGPHVVTPSGDLSSFSLAVDYLTQLACPCGWSAFNEIALFIWFETGSTVASCCVHAHPKYTWTNNGIIPFKYWISMKFFHIRSTFVLTAIWKTSTQLAVKFAFRCERKVHLFMCVLKKLLYFSRFWVKGDLHAQNTTHFLVFLEHKQWCRNLQGIVCFCLEHERIHSPIDGSWQQDIRVLHSDWRFRCENDSLDTENTCTPWSERQKMNLSSAIFQQTVSSLWKTTWITCSQWQISTKTLLLFSEKVAIPWCSIQHSWRVTPDECDHQSGRLSQHTKNMSNILLRLATEHMEFPWAASAGGANHDFRGRVPEIHLSIPTQVFPPLWQTPSAQENSCFMASHEQGVYTADFEKNHSDPNFWHPTMLGWRLSDQHWFAMILAEASAPDFQSLHRNGSSSTMLAFSVFPSFVPTEKASRSVDAKFDWHETLALNFRTLSEMLKNRNWCCCLRAVHRVVLNCCSRLRFLLPKLLSFDLGDHRPHRFHCLVSL